MVDVGSTLNIYIAKLVGSVPLIIEAGAGIILAITLIYFLYIKKPQRKWIVRIWEQAADKRLVYIKKDTLTETFFNNDKQVAYILRDARAEVAPPTWDSIFRERLPSSIPFFPPKLQECVDYLRIEQEHIPIKRMVELGFNELKAGEYLQELVNIKKLSPKEVSERYIFVPANRVVGVEIKYNPMDYDVNMQRINAIDNREKIYADKQKFWDKYGSAIIIGGAIVLVIVVTYLGFDYSNKVLSNSVGPLNNIADGLKQISNNLGGAIASKANAPPV